jgi:CheY-like chemotaxis protein
VEAPDGASALSILDVDAPDVILLDFAMPAMNGAEVAREIRSRWPNLPIVFITGFADTQTIQAIEGEQMNMLRKPFRMSELQRALRTATSDH